MICKPDKRENKLGWIRYMNVFDAPHPRAPFHAFVSFEFSVQATEFSMQTKQSTEEHREELFSRSLYILSHFILIIILYIF